MENPNFGSDKMTGPSSEELFFCPQCKNSSIKIENPVFCIKCGYRFPRDLNGNLIINAENYAELIQIQQPINAPPKRFFLKFNPKFQNHKLEQWHSSWGAALGAGFGIPLIAYMILFIATIGITLHFSFSGFSLESPLFLFIASSLSVIFFLFPMLWVQRYYKTPLTFRDRLAKLGFPAEKYTPFGYFREIMIGVLCAIIGVLIVAILQYFASYIVEWIYGINIFNYLESSGNAEGFSLTSPENFGELMLFISTIFLFVGLPEEILFRGFAQRSFENKMKRPAATLLIAGFFAMFHIYIYILLPPIFVFLFIPYLGISIFLGLVRNWRKDLYAAVAMHIFYDIVQTIIIFMIFA